MSDGQARVDDRSEKKRMQNQAGVITRTIELGLTFFSSAEIRVVRGIVLVACAT